MKKILLSLLCLCLFSSYAFAAAGAADIAKGKKLYTAKKYSQAYAAFEKAAKVNPKNAQAYLFMGYCSLAMKDRDGAVRNIEKSLKIKSDKKLQKYVDALKGNKERGNEKPGQRGGNYNGGYSRILAMGGQVIAPSDPFTSLDLYGSAMNSAWLAFRPGKSLVSAGLGYYGIGTSMSGAIATIPIAESSSTGIFFAALSPVKNLNSATIWLTKDDVINANLIFGLSSISGSVTFGPLTTASTAGATLFFGDIEYARKLMKNMSVGARIGYGGGWFDNDTTETTTGIWTVTSKINWGISAVFSPEMKGSKLSLGLTAGDVCPIGPGGDIDIIDDTHSYEDTSYFDLMTVNSSSASEGGGFRTETKGKTDVSGFNTTLSASFATGKLESIAVLFITAGIGATDSGSSRTIQISNGSVVLENTADPYTSASGGMLFGGGAKARYDFGIASAGLSFKGYTGGINVYAFDGDTAPLNRTLSLARVDAGGALNLKPFTVPVEIFYEGTGNTETDSGNTENSSYSTLGVKAGCEYMLMKELALRAGLSYASMSNSTSFNGTAGPVPGTPENPNMGYFGIHLGAGYKTGSMEFDAALAYKLHSSNPLPENMTVYSGSELLALLGAKIPL